MAFSETLRQAVGEGSARCPGAPSCPPASGLGRGPCVGHVPRAAAPGRSWALQRPWRVAPA
uniref:Alternative protein GCHFR n=1 Tax=Homo sapiens TaxID=9606 RepID=L0R6H1_HUMAN|nr:alternative protein GCHFR [Homo sapiens]